MWRHLESAVPAGGDRSGSNVDTSAGSPIHTASAQLLGRSSNDLKNPLINGKIAGLSFNESGWQPCLRTCGERLRI